MKLTQVERVAVTLYAGSYALLPILAAHHIISDWVVSAVGVVSTAMIGAWTLSRQSTLAAVTSVVDTPQPTQLPAPPTAPVYPGVSEG